MKLLIEKELNFGGNKYVAGDVIEVDDVTARMLLERNKGVSMVVKKLEAKVEKKVVKEVKVAKKIVKESPKKAKEEPKKKPLSAKLKSGINKLRGKKQ